MHVHAGLVGTPHLTLVLHPHLIMSLFILLGPCLRCPRCTQVGREEFDAAILRAVAGIEKKRSILMGVEKDVVAKHEVRRVAFFGHWIWH